MTIVIVLIAAIILGVLFGFSLTVLFWIYIMKKDESISEDENEYIYEFWIDDNDARIKSNKN